MTDPPTNLDPDATLTALIDLNRRVLDLEYAARRHAHVFDLLWMAFITATLTITLVMWLVDANFVRVP